MAEYIERANAAEYFEKSEQIMWHKDDVAATISQPKNIPTADVVEVVRCKDCEYYERCESCLVGVVYVCTKQGCMRVQKEPDDFCSYGHKKEGVEG